MISIKKPLLFLTAVSLFLGTAFTGCEKDKKDVDKPITFSEKRHTLSREVADKIMEAFINNDEEDLYSLLSEETKDFPRVREQIREAFEIFEGEIIFYTPPERAGLASSYISSDIREIRTNSGDVYALSFSAYFIYDDSIMEFNGVGSIVIDHVDISSDIYGDFYKRIGIGVKIQD